MKKFVDLSQEIYTGIPVYPGHLETVIWERLDHEKSKEIYPDMTCSVWGLLMCDHGPTHVDSLYHLDPKGKHR
jgi:kynurenine formamidase